VGHFSEVRVRYVDDAKTHLDTSSLPLAHYATHNDVAQYVPYQHPDYSDDPCSFVGRNRYEDVEANRQSRQRRNESRCFAPTPVDVRQARLAQLAQRELDRTVATRALVLNQPGD
ncbi:MAG: hypothetical protein V3R27_09220, partial [Pseudomonadales bacterium]